VGCVARCRRRLLGIGAGLCRALGACLWARPLAMPHATGTGADMVRSRAQLLAEHALLRQHLRVLRRSVARPAVTRADRALLVLLAGRVRAWRQALLLVQPATLLRWHRAGFPALWRRKSRPGTGRPPLAAEAVALIRKMAADNPVWCGYCIRRPFLAVAWLECQESRLGWSNRTTRGLRHVRDGIYRRSLLRLLTIACNLAAAASCWVVPDHCGTCPWRLALDHS
jgi:hypothetical protein